MDGKVPPRVKRQGARDIQGRESPKSPTRPQTRSQTPNAMLTHFSPLLLLLAALPTAGFAPTPGAGSAAVVQTRTLVPDEQQEKRDLTHFNLGQDNLALEGYDPVAYFKVGGGKPAKGSKSITLTQRGVQYRFASEQNRELFEQKPASFEPLYGGWCAYAMSKEAKVEVDPKSFLVTDGQLKLFYKGFLNDTRKKWVKEPKVLKPKADAYWKALHTKQG